MSNLIVLDSYAVLAFFQNESGADTIREMILSAVEQDINLAMCTVNLGEVWYSLARKNSIEIADSYINELQNMPIEIVDTDWELTRQASLYKIRGGLSYADCYVAALAKLRNGEVITGDKEFKSLEKEIKIRWLK